MVRRRFLAQTSGALSLGLWSACAPRLAPGRTRARAPIRAICFDLFTLFDPRSVVAAAEEVAPGRAAELCEAWRARQFEYAWLRVAGRRYLDFQRVTEDALIYAARARGIALAKEQRERLVGAYSRLSPWPDARATLTELKRRGLRLAPLSNYAPGMLRDLISRAGMTDLFDALISTHAARTFKPDPRAYALGEEALGLARERIAFSAFGGWDAAGARWFGYPTFWVNRLAQAREELEPGPHAAGPGLTELARFVEVWPGSAAQRSHP